MRIKCLYSLYIISLKVHVVTMSYFQNIILNLRDFSWNFWDWHFWSENSQITKLVCGYSEVHGTKKLIYKTCLKGHNAQHQIIKFLNLLCKNFSLVIKIINSVDLFKQPWKKIVENGANWFY